MTMVSWASRYHVMIHRLQDTGPPEAVTGVGLDTLKAKSRSIRQQQHDLITGKILQARRADGPII
jgi:hypothetical protein